MTIKVPVYHTLGIKKPKTIFLSLNWYRNAHFMINNKVKQDIEDIIISQLPTNPPKLTNYQAIYTYHYKSRTSDLPNVCALTSKYINDALKSKGLIPDDNVQYLKKETYLVGSHNKLDPHVEVQIGEYNDPNNSLNNTSE